MGAFGSAEGQFIFPFALTIDDAGAVYVIDGDNGGISKFGAGGAFAWRVGGPSGDPALRGAHDLAAMKDGTILVTFDPGGPAILLDPDDGSIIGPWGEESLGWSAQPTVDPDGNVFLFQYVPGAMRMFDAEGHPLGMTGFTRTTFRTRIASIRRRSSRRTATAIASTTRRDSSGWKSLARCRVGDSGGSSQ